MPLPGTTACPSACLGYDGLTIIDDLDIGWAHIRWSQMRTLVLIGSTSGPICQYLVQQPSSLGYNIVDEDLGISRVHIWAHPPVSDTTAQPSSMRTYVLVGSISRPINQYLVQQPARRGYVLGPSTCLGYDGPTEDLGIVGSISGSIRQYLVQQPAQRGCVLGPSAGLRYDSPTIIDEDLGMVGSISGPVCLYLVQQPARRGYVLGPSAGLGYDSPTIIDEDLGMVGSISGPVCLYLVQQPARRGYVLGPSAGLGYDSPTIIDGGPRNGWVHIWAHPPVPGTTACPMRLCSGPIHLYRLAHWSIDYYPSLQIIHNYYMMLAHPSPPKIAFMAGPPALSAYGPT
ncbi:hypothetical protein BDR06DRAFT_968432 [Suillus hirtellus]|nr:hypothetical protein BDR06DRAFT_968432 [Suillus hirtellus]